MSENESPEVLESVQADGMEYPPETSRFLSWGAVSLIKAPSPRHLLRPVFVILVLFVLATGVILKSEAVDSTVTQGRIVLQQSSTVWAPSGGMVVKTPVKVGQSVLKGESLLVLEDGTAIRSSQKGVLFRRYAETGSRVGANEAVAIVADPASDWIARIELEEKDLPIFKPGQEVVLKWANRPELGSTTGKLKELIRHRSPQETPLGEGGAYTVSLDFDPATAQWIREHASGVFGARVEATVILGRAPASNVLKKVIFGY